MEDNPLKIGRSEYNMTFRLPEPVNKVKVYDDELEIDDDNKIIMNGKEVETLEETQKALAIMIKTLCVAFS